MLGPLRLMHGEDGPVSAQVRWGKTGLACLPHHRLAPAGDSVSRALPAGAAPRGRSSLPRFRSLDRAARHPPANGIEFRFHVCDRAGRNLDGVINKFAGVPEPRPPDAELTEAQIRALTRRAIELGNHPNTNLRRLIGRDEAVVLLVNRDAEPAEIDK